MASGINIDEIPSAAPPRGQAQEIDISQIPSAVNIDEMPSAKASLMDRLREMAPKAADQAFRKMFHLPNGWKDVESAGKVVNYPVNVLGTAGLSAAKHLMSGDGLGEGRDIKSALMMNGKSAPEVLQKDFGMGKVGSYAAGLPYEVALQMLTGSAGKKLIGAARKSDIGQEIAGKIKSYFKEAEPTPSGTSAMTVAPPVKPDIPEGEITGDGGSLLDSLTRPIANRMDKAGRGLYHNVFRKVDADAAKFKGANEVGEHPFSDLAYDKEFLQGGMSPLEMEHAAGNYRDSVIGPQYNEIVDSPAVSSQRGTLTGSISQDTKDFLQDNATRSLDRPGAMAVANQINKDAQIARTPLGRKVFDNGGRSPRQLLDLAKSYSDTARGTQGLPGDIMKKGANESSYKQGLMNFAQDLRDKVQQLAENALPGNRAKIQELNSQYQILKTAAKPLLNASMVEARKLPVTQADSVLGGLGVLEALKHGDPTVGAMFGLKRAAKYLNSPGGGVRMGNTLKAASKTNAWDAILRQGILDRNEDK